MTQWRHRPARGPALGTGPDPWSPPGGVAGRKLAPSTLQPDPLLPCPGLDVVLGLLIQQPPGFLVPGSPLGLLEAFGLGRELARVGERMDIWVPSVVRTLEP